MKKFQLLIQTEEGLAIEGFNELNSAIKSKNEYDSSYNATIYEKIIPQPSKKILKIKGMFKNDKETNI